MRLIQGGTAGKGTLHFQGKDYVFTFKTSSAGLGAKAVTSVTAKGSVFGPAADRGLRGQVHLDNQGRHRRQLAGTGEVQERQGRRHRPGRHGQGAGLSLGGGLATIKLVKE
jgi:hypothetical protein